MEEEELIVSAFAVKLTLQVSAFDNVDDVTIEILRVSDRELESTLISEEVGFISSCID